MAEFKFYLKHDALATFLANYHLRPDPVQGSIKE